VTEGGENNEQGQGPLGEVTDQVGQVTQGVQDSAGQAVGQVGQAAEGLALGTQLLGEGTNEAGQTVQRTVDEAGNIVENTLDESGGILEETPVGSITDLPAEEEYQTEEGQTVRTVKDESGTLIQLQLGEDGSLLNLQIPPPTETEETTEEYSSQQGGEDQEGGPQNLSQQIQEQTVSSAQGFFGESLGRLKGQLQSDRAQLESLTEQIPDEEAQAQIQEMVDTFSEIENSLDQGAQDLGIEDAVNQALQQAQDTAGQVAGQAQQAAGQVTNQAGQAAEGVQEAAGGAAQQAQGAARGGGQEEEPNATVAARQKAEELGVDLSQVEGSGAEGRIIVKDVTSAANQG
jgi:pyruvate/2-oxoglutarate dehydrogenase complex dihydrolipoamide acyltransferase (E2) component